MELLELLFSLPDLICLFYYLFRGLWWLCKGVVTLVGWIVRGVGRGCRWLFERVRDRWRNRDFPTATVVTDRTELRARDPAW